MARKKISNEILAVKVKGANKLLKLCGGTQRKMSCVFNISQQAVTWWLRRGVPVTYREKILQYFGNDIKEYELWPDVFNGENKLDETVDN